MRTEEPRAVHLKDYRAPDYRASEIALDFVLDPEATRVTATMKLARTGAPAPLVLDGEHLKLVSVAVDGRALSPDEYKIEPETLTIATVPERFTLDVVTEISPAKNTALEGLYLVKGIFCTQCEAEALGALPISSTGRTCWRSTPRASRRRRPTIPCCCRTAIRSPKAS